MTNEELLSKIKTEKTTLTTYWNERNERLLADRKLINLVEERKVTTKDVKWKTNEPKVFFETSRALISINAPRFRLPMSINPEAEEKDKMNKAERLCLGIMRQLDLDIFASGGVSWLWNLAYWILLGSWSVFAVVEKTLDGVKFTADIWDPLTVLPQWDRLGLKRCIRTYNVDKITAIAMAEDFKTQGLEFDFTEPTEGPVEIDNYWLRTQSKQKPQIWNAIAVAGQVVKPLTLHRKLTRIPIHVGNVGSPDTISENWKKRMSESIVSANRSMYEYTDTIISLMTTILAETAYPNVVEKTLTGRSAIRSEDLKGYGKKITLKPQESIELLKHASTPAEVNYILQWLQQNKQKASVPDTVYGHLPFELSGFALSQLLAAVKYKLGPYINAMQFVTSHLMADFLHQYKTGSFPAITLSTENPKDIKRGLTYMEEFTRADVPQRIYVDVEIPITSQFDKTQAILNSVQAFQAGLLSKETLWEMDLDIQDTEMERERQRQDRVEANPVVQQIEIIEGMKAKRDTYYAMNNRMAGDALNQYIMQMEMEIGMRQGIPQTAQQGVRPELMSAEASTSPNPDELKAMLGQAPGGVKRRAQTPEERAESKGRKGRLVSPGGAPL